MSNSPPENNKKPPRQMVPIRAEVVEETKKAYNEDRAALVRQGITSWTGFLSMLTSLGLESYRQTHPKLGHDSRPRD
jgi:hypothetical protein